MALFALARTTPTGLLSDGVTTGVTHYVNLDQAIEIVSLQDPSQSEATSKYYVAARLLDGDTHWIKSAAGYADKATADAAIVTMLGANLLS